MAESTIAADIRSSPDWRAAVERADGWVRERLTRYADTKRFDWKLTPDGRQVEFRMGMFDTEVCERFDAATLRDERRVKERAWESLDRLLAEGMRAEFAGIRTLLRELAAEEAVREAAGSVH